MGRGGGPSSTTRGEATGLLSKRLTFEGRNTELKISWDAGLSRNQRRQERAMAKGVEKRDGAAARTKKRISLLRIMPRKHRGLQGSLLQHTSDG